MQSLQCGRLNSMISESFLPTKACVEGLLNVVSVSEALQQVLRALSCPTTHFDCCKTIELK